MSAVKPSHILLLAAEKVNNYLVSGDPNDAREYGCHAIDMAAIELGALSASQAGNIRQQTELRRDLPEVWKYFSLFAPDGGEGGIWFVGNNNYTSNLEQRILALTMAAAIAKAERN